jgi:hypothetical protein
MSVNRRAFLKSTSIGIAAISGCVSQLHSQYVAPNSPLETEFEVYEPGSEAYENAPEIQRRPTVEFRPEETQVVVVGKFFVGSSDCNRAVLENAAYDSDSKHLDIRVGSGSKDSDENGCSADESPDAYRLTVALAEEIPDSVTVVQAGNEENEWTVQR